MYMNFVILKGLRKIPNFKFKISQKLLMYARSAEIAAAQFPSPCVYATFHLHTAGFLSDCVHCAAAPYQLLSGPPSFPPCDDCALAFYVLVCLLTLLLYFDVLLLTSIPSLCSLFSPRLLLRI